MMGKENNGRKARYGKRRDGKEKITRNRTVDGIWKLGYVMYTRRGRSIICAEEAEQGCVWGANKSMIGTSRGEKQKTEEGGEEKDIRTEEVAGGTTKGERMDKRRVERAKT